ncbi:MAG TPA: GDP-mannose 4,6-dehydratase [Solirubrobacteraceae bacterium]|nr:GDP-mannose 4,6-dehydratase [Solirubrobacteraceae bacterium]
MTGAAGFAGSWLVRASAEAGDEVFALSRSPVPILGAAASLTVDLRDGDAVRAAVRRAEPEVIYHLGALSSVGRSWDEPARTVNENAATAVNVLEAVRLDAPDARVVWVSSCEVYGPPAALPVRESAQMAPASPYAVSKASGEMLATVYAESFGLDLVRARPFSHSGPGQRPIFLLSSLARQVAEGRAAEADRIRVVTGNPDTRRDFTDVRDTVRAYRLLASSGADGAFNVSSGRSVSCAEHVQLLADLVSPIAVEHAVDPARVRAHEVMDLRGDHSLLTAATGWAPQIPLRQTISDTLAWWERELAGVG